MKTVQRDHYLQNLISRMDNGMIKVVTGIRRCGKTFLVFTLFKDYLLSLGVDGTHIIELALDEERNAAYRNPEALDAYLRMRIPHDDKTTYILLDEVQFAISRSELRKEEPPKLYGVLNGLLRMQNIDVYVTGSNSKFLSSDIMTEFRGRGDEVRIHPFSFSEFMQAFEGDIYQGWAEYVLYGGMPLTLGMKTDEQKMRYLENLFSEVYMKDILARYRLDKTGEFDSLVNVIASSIGSLTSTKKLVDTFKGELRSNISAATVDRYLQLLEESFLVTEAQRYDVKGRKYIGSPKKLYFEDMGLRNARLGFRQVEETHIMENIIFNELKMRGYSVDVGIVEKRTSCNGKEARKMLEVDFVANLGYQRLYIQSALSMPDEAKEQQEKAPLNAISDSFEKIVLVKDMRKPYRDVNGVLTMSVFDFLLSNSAK